VGSYRAMWARVGNSVLALFMKAIAKHVRIDILKNRGRPDNFPRFRTQVLASSSPEGYHFRKSRCPNC